jgi:signal transduction histidine kinase
VARPVRTQLTYGAAVVLALFLTAVALASRFTFLEQVRQLEEQSRIIAASVTATAQAGHLTRETIASAMVALPVPDDGIVVVLDVAAGKVAAARGAAAVVTAIAGEHIADNITRTDADGVRRAYGSAWTQDRLCQVVVGLPQRLVPERLLPMYKRNVVFAAIYYLVSIAGLYVLLGRWGRSLGYLESFAARVSSGDLRTPDVQPMATRELEHMQRTMIEMITRVRELQRQVVRQERLAAIGTLVSGVAHEISNPLQSILGSAQVIQANDELPISVRADLAVIQQESLRAGGIIRNLTKFTRQQPVGPSPVRLKEIVEWLSDLWRGRLDEQSIHLDIDDKSRRMVNVVASELQQVALNFLVNAEYAVLHTARTERRLMVRTRDLASGSVRLEVEDTGDGVSAEDEGKLFQPFYTTKPVGDGTGLGLSVSYGIIHSYGGVIGYERGTMGGACFYFELPAQER